MFTATLFMIAKKMKRIQISIHWWKGKQNVIYIYGTQWHFIWTQKKNEVLIHATTWVNLKNIMLRERSQTQRPSIVWFHLQEMYTTGIFMETENRLAAA